MATLYQKLEVDPVLKGIANMGYTPNRGAVVAPDSVLGRDGRTYHGLSQGTYYMPNDASEQDRLDMQHQQCKLILDNKPGLAPVKSPRQVLDVATGTGIWAIEYARNNPQTQVLGTDLSQIQPSTTLPNVTFLQQDVEKEPWAFPNQVDYIHFRFIITCFDDTRSVFRKAYHGLQPGGYIEILDITPQAHYIDDTRAPAVDEFLSLLQEAAAKAGRDFEKADKYKGWLEEVGFVDVVETRFKSPGNAWPRDETMKKIGVYQMLSKMGVFENLSEFIKTLGIPHGEIDELFAAAVRELQDTSIHMWWPINIVYGRKPLQGEAV